MPDEQHPAHPVSYRYRSQVLDQLGMHGLVPGTETPPERLRDALSDLYRHEIRTTRAHLLEGRIERAHYVNHILELRRRYWLLSVPTALWLQQRE